MSLSCLSHVKRNGNSKERPSVSLDVQKSTFKVEHQNVPLSMHDVHNFLLMAYREIFKSNPQIEALLGASAEELATATSEQGFMDAGISFGGCMTWNEWKLLLDGNDIIHTDGSIEIGGKSRAPISSVIYESEYPLWDGEYDDEGRLCGGEYRDFRDGMSREEYRDFRDVYTAAADAVLARDGMSREEYEEPSENELSVQAENEDSSDFDDLELGEFSEDSYYEPSTPPRGPNAEKTGPPDIMREYQEAKSFKRGVGRFVLLDPRDDEMGSSDDEMGSSDDEMDSSEDLDIKSILSRLEREVPFIGVKEFSHNKVGLILKELSDLWGYESVFNPKIAALVKEYKLDEKGWGHLAEKGNGHVVIDVAEEEDETDDTLVVEDDGYTQYQSSFGYGDEYGYFEGDTGAGILYCAGIGSPR